MSDTPRTDKFAQKFLLTWNQFAYRSDEDIAKQFQNTDDALDLARQLERELAEAQEELNDKRKFCYAVEQALDGLKGDYVEIIKELRKDAERYRWLRDNTCKSSLYEHCGIEGYDTEVMISGEVLDAAIDAAMNEGK